MFGKLFYCQVLVFGLVAVFPDNFFVEWFSLWMFIFGSSVLNVVLPMLFVPEMRQKKIFSCQVLVFVGFTIRVFGSASMPFVFVVRVKSERSGSNRHTHTPHLRMFVGCVVFFVCFSSLVAVLFGFVCPPI